MNSIAARADLESHDERRERRIAWLMVWMSMLGTMCCSTSVVLINVGIVMKPLSDTFGWSRGAVAASLSIAALTMAAANPFVGRAIDRYGVKPVLISSLVAYGVATALIPNLVGLFGIWGLYLGYALVAGLGAGSNVIAYVRLLSGWFDGAMSASRGLALGVSAAGVPLGAMVTGPIAVLVISHYGWAAGYWALALLPLVIGLPVAHFGLRTAPAETECRTEDGVAMEQAGLTAREAATTRPFWVLIAIVLLMSSCLQGMGIHTAPLLSDFGISPATLALVTAIDGAVGILGRIAAGHLFDRVFAPRASIFIFTLAAIAALAVVAFPILSIGIVGTLLISLGSGAESDFVGYSVGRYFGLRNYGQIFGTIYAMFMVGIAIGPLLFGLGFDYFGGYAVPFTIGAIGLAILCGLLATLPRFPESGHLECKSRGDARREA